MKPAIYEVTACTANEGFTWIPKLLGGGLYASHTLRAEKGFTEAELSFFSKGAIAAIAPTLFSSKIFRFVATETRGLKEKCDRLVSIRG